MQFKPFPKIPRFFRDITITEKIDGTNASIFLSEEPPEKCLTSNGSLYMFAGSRNRWVTPESDNYGFARWCLENQEKLFNLGPGHHFGEWWGNDIQRNYGLKEKRFSLFNTKRWGVHVQQDGFVEHTGCYTVPVLYQGGFSPNAYQSALTDLCCSGSVAVPGFMKPEGIIIHHEASNHLYKVLLENDDKPKGAIESS